MRHMLAQFGPALKLPWTKLVAPELTEELSEAVIQGCEQQTAGYEIADIENRRDDFPNRAAAIARKILACSELKRKNLRGSEAP